MSKLNPPLVNENDLRLSGKSRVAAYFLVAFLGLFVTSVLAKPAHVVITVPDGVTTAGSERLATAAQKLD